MIYSIEKKNRKSVLFTITKQLLIGANSSHLFLYLNTSHIKSRQEKGMGETV